MRDVELDRRVLGLESSRATILFTPKVPICADRTLSFLRKDRDTRHLRHLGNPDIADISTVGSGLHLHNLSEKSGTTSLVA